MWSAWRSRAAVGALLLTGALAACGDSDDAESGSGAETATPAQTETANETATPTAEPTAEPTPDTTEDKRIAEESVLTLDDFPSGWTAADDTSSSPAQCDEFDLIEIPGSDGGVLDGVLAKGPGERGPVWRRERRSTRGYVARHPGAL